jgi:hypothetical protein
MDCGPFFFRARAVGVDFHDGTVDGQGLHLDADDLFFLQRGEHPIEHPGPGPAGHAGVDGVPPTEPLRQPTPFAPMLGHVQNRVQHVQVRRPQHCPAASESSSQRVETEKGIMTLQLLTPTP